MATTKIVYYETVFYYYNFYFVDKIDKNYDIDSLFIVSKLIAT